MDDWDSRLVAESALPPDGARQLDELGFVVLPGPAIAGGVARLAEAYDRAVATADAADVSVRASTRVHDFVNRGPEFDGLYIYPPLLAACRRVIGRPFKLSSMLARTLPFGTPAQPLHIDVKRHADGWPLVGFIVMVDEFHAENGATRFVPGSHMWPHEPDEVAGSTDTHVGEVLACGPPGSIIIYNGSVWHGFTANRSSRCRRSVQGAFIARIRQERQKGHSLRAIAELLDRAGVRCRAGRWGHSTVRSILTRASCSRDQRCPE